jgi:hypothetical protein
VWGRTLRTDASGTIATLLEDQPGRCRGDPTARLEGAWFRARALLCLAPREGITSATALDAPVVNALMARNRGESRHPDADSHLEQSSYVAYALFE